MKHADVTFKGNVFQVSGDLDIWNVMSVYAKSIPDLQIPDRLEFDFSRLKSSDSAGLALMIEWVKFARRINKPVRFGHLSQDMLNIARAAGLDGLINCLDGYAAPAS